MNSLIPKNQLNIPWFVSNQPDYVIQFNELAGYGYIYLVQYYHVIITAEYSLAGCI